MSNFLSVAGGSGTSLTGTVKGAQSYGFVMLFPGAYKAGSGQQMTCTSVSDSKGGTWDATVAGHIGPFSGTNDTPNTLSCGPTFMRTAGDNLTDGDSITAHWDHSSDHNIFVACQIGGCQQSIVSTQYDSYTNGRANYLNTGEGSAIGGLAWSNSEQPNFMATDYPVPTKYAEVISYAIVQPGARNMTGGSIDFYISNYNSGTGLGDMTMLIAQQPVAVGDSAQLGFGTGFSNPQMAVGNYQCYDPSFLFGQAPGATGPADTPTVIGHIKHRKR